jgi:hypothetical protein
MIGSELIAKFNLFTEDSTELSASEELALLNSKYSFFCSLKSYEFLKKPASGTTSTSVPYITMPTDFSHFAENNQSADDGDNPKVIFVGSSYRPYKIVNFSDRRQYRDQDGYAYLDVVNSRIYFTKQPTTAEAYEFDYICVPAVLTLATSPIFPERFQDVLPYMMAVDSFIIQQYPKAQSYAPENQSKANDILSNIDLWNGNLTNV